MRERRVRMSEEMKIQYVARGKEIREEVKSLCKQERDVWKTNLMDTEKLILLGEVY